MLVFFLKIIFRMRTRRPLVPDYYSVKPTPSKGSIELLTVPDICGLVKNNTNYLVTELVLKNCIKICATYWREFKRLDKHCSR